MSSITRDSVSNVRATQPSGIPLDVGIPASLTSRPTVTSAPFAAASVVGSPHMAAGDSPASLYGRALDLSDSPGSSVLDGGVFGLSDATRFLRSGPLADPADDVVGLVARPWMQHRPYQPLYDAIPYSAPREPDSVSVSVDALISAVLDSGLPVTVDCGPAFQERHEGGAGDPCVCGAPDRARRNRVLFPGSVRDAGCVCGGSDWQGRRLPYAPCDFAETDQGDVVFRPRPAWMRAAHAAAAAAAAEDKSEGGGEEEEQEGVESAQSEKASQHASDGVGSNAGGHDAAEEDESLAALALVSAADLLGTPTEDPRLKARRAGSGRGTGVGRSEAATRRALAAKATGELARSRAGGHVGVGRASPWTAMVVRTGMAGESAVLTSADWSCLPLMTHHLSLTRPFPAPPTSRLCSAVRASVGPLDARLGLLAGHRRLRTRGHRDAPPRHRLLVSLLSEEFALRVGGNHRVHTKSLSLPRSRSLSAHPALAVGPPPARASMATSRVLAD